MAAFPSIRAPIHPLDPDGELEDAAVRSPFEGGYQQTRPRYTRARRRFGVRYRLQSSDLWTLRTFELTTLRNGADSFTWTHPTTSTSYTVRLAAPIAYARAQYGIWDVSMTLEEV